MARKVWRLWLCRIFEWLCISVAEPGTMPLLISRGQTSPVSLKRMVLPEDLVALPVSREHAHTVPISGFACSRTGVVFINVFGVGG